MHLAGEKRTTKSNRDSHRETESLTSQRVGCKLHVVEPMRVHSPALT